MAYIDEAAFTSQDIVSLGTKSDFLSLAKNLLWAEFEKHKNESYKGTTWGIPWSIKIEKAEPLLVKFLGPNPYN